MINQILFALGCYLGFGVLVLIVIACLVYFIKCAVWLLEKL